MGGILSKYLQSQRMKQLSQYLKGDILDVGCGSAEVANLISKNQRYVGIDYSKELINQVKLKFKEDSKKIFYSKNFEKDNFNEIKGKFDTILFIAVIEHLENPRNILIEMKKKVKKNGSIIIITLTPFANEIHRFFSNFGIFSKKAVEEHKILYNYKLMEKTLKSNNLKIKKFKRFQFGLNQVFITTLSDK